MARSALFIPLVTRHSSLWFLLTNSLPIILIFSLSSIHSSPYAHKVLLKERMKSFTANFSIRCTWVNQESEVVPVVGRVRAGSRRWQMSGNYFHYTNSSIILLIITILLAQLTSAATSTQNKSIAKNAFLFETVLCLDSTIFWLHVKYAKTFAKMLFNCQTAKWDINKATLLIYKEYPPLWSELNNHFKIRPSNFLSNNDWMHGLRYRDALW